MTPHKKFDTHPNQIETPGTYDEPWINVTRNADGTFDIETHDSHPQRLSPKAAKQLRKFLKGTR